MRKKNEVERKKIWTGYFKNEIKGYKYARVKKCFIEILIDGICLQGLGSSVTFEDPGSE